MKSYFNYFWKVCRMHLSAYDKDYKKICPIEKDLAPAPVLPLPVTLLWLLMNLLPILRRKL